VGRRNKPRPGEFVSLKDIASYALPAHAECGGRGYIGTFLVDEKLCDCARVRFLDANMFRIFPDEEADGLRWGPNPPTADELREAAKRIGGEGWAQFKKDSHPDRVKTEEDL
jgi:hypothetical protein